MRIVVTGASGVIGRAVVPELRGHDLCLVGRSAERLSREFPGQEVCQTDYSAASLEAAIAGASAIVHLAAERPNASLATFDAFYRPNVLVTENLFRACATRGVGNIVFASTGSVYSTHHNQLPFDESQVVYPSSFYAISKLTCEKLAYRYRLNAKSLRITHVLSAAEREGYMLRTFMDRARAGQELTVFGRGLGAREYVYVKDVARAISSALAADGARGVYNIGMGTLTSHLELAQTIASEFGGGNASVRCDPSKPDDPERHLMTTAKARTELKWEPRFDLAASFADMAQNR